MQSIRQVLRASIADGTRCVFPSCCISTGAVTNMPVKVGDKIPSVYLYENSPENKLNTVDLFGKGKHVIFAIVGALTPTCAEQQAPTFVRDFEKFKTKGVDSVSCISVNDPFVMDFFGKSLKAEGKVRMFADTCGDFTKAIDMEFDVTTVLGSVRSKRYAMVVNDGVVTGVKAEESSGQATCTRSDDIMGFL